MVALSGSLTAANAKSPLAPYDGTWAHSVEQCRDPNFINQRVVIDAEAGQVFDNRGGDIECRIDKQRHYKDGVNLDLVCQHGQEPPYNFRTDISLLRTGPNRLAVTNSFVDRKPESLDLIRCKDSDLPKHTVYPGTPSAGPQYELPPLKEGEFYEGQAYPADYEERRAELLGEKAKPLTRAKNEICTHAFCRKYPEIRACYADYCVGRWQRADSATVDYVVKPDTLEVLKIVCRDTCGADEIRRPAR